MFKPNERVIWIAPSGREYEAFILSEQEPGNYFIQTIPHGGTIYVAAQDLRPVQEVPQVFATFLRKFT